MDVSSRRCGGDGHSLMESIMIGVCTVIAMRGALHDIVNTPLNVWRYVSRLCGRVCAGIGI